MGSHLRHLVPVAALALLAACAEPSAESAGEDPGAVAPTGTPAPDDLVASCGSVSFDSLPADPSAFPPLDESDWDDIDLREIEGEAEIFERHDWSVVAETDDTLALFGVPRQEVPPEATSSYAYATFTREGERWVPSGWGGCRISVAAPDWGNARFVLDPDVEPGSSATSISVLAWEVNCASGQTPDDREVTPVTLSQDEDTVSIVILVEPVSEGATCQSNPSFPLEIPLDAPLGDRTVLDASVDPALERPWPPTESSLSTQGLES